MNKLDFPLKNQTSIKVFKRGSSDWVKKNILVKPKPSIGSQEALIKTKT